MQNVSNFCRELLPIIGVVVLVVLIIVLFKTIKLLVSLQETVIKTHGSIEIVEETLNKAQVPVDAAVKIAKGVDGAYDASNKALDEAKGYLVKNISGIKEKVKELLKKNSSKEEIELKEISSDDILDKGEQENGRKED